jgi:hypothetical protein
VLGEWSGQSALVDALAQTLAVVRASAGPPPAAIAHRIDVTFTPPAGAPTTQHIELGPGCAGRIDGAPVVVPLPLCTAATAVAAR